MTSKLTAFEALRHKPLASVAPEYITFEHCMQRLRHYDDPPGFSTEGLIPNIPTHLLEACELQCKLEGIPFDKKTDPFVELHE